MRTIRRRETRVLRRVEEFFLKPNLETRDAFDEFVVDKKRVLSALAACEGFLTELQRFRLMYTSNDEERKSLQIALRRVQDILREPMECARR